MKKLYKFVANSSLSFAVIHCGRMMYINFSAFFRGKSTYHTTDRELAEKIRAHKWYREGRITEIIEEDEDVIHDENEENSVLQEKEVKQRYSILGKRMCTYIPPASSNQEEKESRSTEQTGEKEEVIQEDRDIQEDIENVTSFLEAKDFFEVRFKVPRSQCGNKETLSSLCKEHGIQFPNYPLD
ncbi:hypothetical protein [Phocaeicola vulgatus]|mgnify:FL=1|jgi:hypothetical protein|uniref:hypothetical protein n=1 Tax=Phocaeicola vulgatus TaxID=821 RepID=UPI0021669FC7|nr:hypothetical protein [Phocaeicola vulgatus]MCS2996874.1 hypothetical protein [Phocaeicola vulgatus]